MNKNKKHYLIYQIANLINGKIYIGKHETTNIEDEYFGSGKYLKRAINKYGLENFVKTILFELQNEEEMNLLEKCVVTQEFCDREDTYNINVGGDGGWDYVNKINKTSKFYLAGGLANKLKIENMSDSEYQQHCLNLSLKKQSWDKNHPGYFAGERNPMYGHVYTDETRRKMSINKTGSQNFQYGKMWICNDLTRESKSIQKTDPIPEGWRKGRICKKY